MNRKIYLFSIALVCAQPIVGNDSYAGSPAYQAIMAAQASLTDRVAMLVRLLDNPYMSPAPGVAYVPTLIGSGQPVNTVQVPLRTTTTFYSQEEDQDYTYQQISQMMRAILGSGGTSGYSLLFKQAWTFYSTQNPPAVADFFQAHSLGIQLYAGVAGSAITYLQKFLSSISSNNYAQADLATGLKTEIALLDQAIDDAATSFTKHMSGVNADLAKNYMTIKQNYHQRKAQLLLAWLDPLLSQLVTLYPAHVRHDKLTTDLAIQNVQIYVQVLFDSLSVFSADQATTMLGTYTSVADVVAAFSNQLAQLFLYQAQCFQYAVDYNIQLWGQPGTALTQAQVTTLTSQIQSAASLLSSAASYSATAQQTNSAQVYAQQSAALLAGLQNWQMAVKNAGQGYMGQVAQLLDQASEQFKNAGNTYVGSYLYQQFQQALLLYDNSLFATYGNYYQPLIAQYVAQAQQVPTSTTVTNMTQQHQQFQSLFYPLNSQDAQNATYKGMGWLAQLALPSYKEILSALQSNTTGTNSSSTQNSQQLLLQQGITLLQSIAQGSQYMFYTSPEVFGGNSLPADQNGSSYTVKGLVAAVEQYNTIIHLFGMADQVIAQAGANVTSLPFAQVLPTTGSVTSWKQLIMLHQAYWFLINAQQARDFVTNCQTSAAQTDELISAAVVGFLQAQATYRALGLSAMVSYIQTQLNTLVGSTLTPVTYGSKTVEKILQNQAATYVAGPMPSLLSRQAALTCYQAGGLLGSEVCRAKFFSTLDDYRTVLQAQTGTPGDITNLAKAFGLTALDIQGMYAQKAGWQTTNVYLDNFAIDSAVASTELSNMAQLTGTIDQQIALQKQFVLFYQEYQAFEVEQRRLASLYGLTIDPYLTVKGSSTSVTFKNQTTTLAQLTEPSYKLAQLLVQSAKSQLAAVQKTVANNTVTGSLMDTIATIESLYNQAIGYYSQAGVQDAVVATEQLKTQAIAALYYALVIPSNRVTALQAALSKTPSVVPTTQPSANNMLLPLYLLRSVSIDITALAKTFVDSASLTQAVIQSSSLQVAGTTNPDLTQEIAAAQALVKNAQALVGKSTTDAASMQALVTQLLVPLYRLQLQQEGYTGFLSLDDKVQEYQQQITLLMSSGMTVGSTTYTTSYSVVSEKSTDGTDHIVVQGTNVPLDAVVQYQGQTQSALLYYMLCGKFYDTSNPTTSIGDVTYMTVTDPVAQQKITDAQRLTYIAGTRSYTDAIVAYLKTLTLPDGKTLLSAATLAQKTSLNFSDYQDAYTTITSMYIGALSLLDMLGNDPNSSLNVDAEKTKIYAQFAVTSSYFLMGNPASGSFQSVLKDVANNYYSANQTAPMAVLYEAIADYTCTLPLALTQTNGYPSATATPIFRGYDASGNLVTGTPTYDPIALGNLATINQALAKNKIAPCAAGPTTPLYPYTQSLSWYNYQQAAAFYQQAYTVYQQGLTGSKAAPQNLLQDPTLVRLYGKFFYYDFFSAVQALSLFARNAYQVGFNPDLSTATVGVLTGSMAPDFSTIIKQGGSAGATSATDDFDQLTAGAQVTTATNAAQQYATMRSLMLNAILYMTGLQGALNQLLQTIGVDQAYSGQSVAISNPLATQYGQLLQCSLSQYIPGLQVLIGGANITNAGSATGSVDTLKPVIELPSYLVNLQTSFEPIFQARIVHATTFLTAMQYMVENSIGSPANQFAPLGNSTNSYLNLLVFNKLVSELWSVMRDLYGQAFLADLYAKKDVTGYENAIDAAISAQQQQTIINPASYIG